MRFQRRLTVVPLVLVVGTLLLFGCHGSQREDQGQHRYGASGDVPFVPTPPEVVDGMLELANVKASDIVYDLGCGDGRIVIEAAQKFHARGVGVDINPERIREAEENARKAGIADRVRFVNQDLFEADISQATVVTLYLLARVNLKLRPKLLDELRPGTRIVSNTYDMGDWRPDKAIEVMDRQIYLWVTP